MVKTPRFQCKVLGFNPWSVNEIPPSTTKSSNAPIKDSACHNKDQRSPHAAAKTWLSQTNKQTHSGILVWRIPWTEEPGRLQSIYTHIHNNITHNRHTHTHTRFIESVLFMPTNRGVWAFFFFFFKLSLNRMKRH